MSDAEDNDESSNHESESGGEESSSDVMSLQSGADDDDDDAEEEDYEDQEEEEEDDDGEGNSSAAAAGVNDDELDEEDDDNYLEKFERDVNKDYVNDFHPECISHNYEEVSALCVVTRDEHCIINDKLHKTIPFLTKYERARVLGQRAKQIEHGAPPLVTIDKSLIESYIIAEMELEAKKIPFIIKRPIPGGGFEYWRLIDLELIAF